MIAPSGIGMWVVSLNATGETSSIIERCKRSAISWLAVRSGDTARSAAWAARASSFVAAAHDAGVRVYSWHYCRPADLERQVAHVAANRAAGVDGHILDAEIEFELANGAPDIAHLLMARLRATVGEDFWLAHAPFAFPRSHLGFPYEALGARCNAVMPQIYWTYQGAAATVLPRFDAQWSELAARTPAAVPARMPIGVTYGREIAARGERNPPGYAITSGDVALFVQRYREGAPSLYSWDSASPSAWAVLEGYARASADAWPVAPELVVRPPSLAPHD